MNTKLYIENQEIELKDEVQFLLNKQFEDITNPTVIINDWSKTVEIPSTQHNDDVFGHIYSPDKIIMEESVPSVLIKTESNKLTTSYYSPVSDRYNTTFDANVNYAHITMTPTPNVGSGSFTSFEVYVGELASGSPYDQLTHSRQIGNVRSGVQRITFTATEHNNAIKLAANGGADYYPAFVLANGINHDMFTPGVEYTFIIDFATAQWGNVSDIDLDFKVSLAAKVFDYKHFGVYFDPYRKLDFRLELNESTIMEGYAKLNEIKRTGSKTVYSVTLNGSLGKVFQELKKITFDKALLNSEDSKYVIPGWEYYKERMSKEIVYNSWIYSRTHNTLNNARPDEIIGWAANNAFSDDFDYTSYVASDDLTIKQFKDALPADFQSVKRIDPASLLENGLKPRDIGEFRSYNQLPFYYWDMFWYIFQAKAESLTGYTWDCTDNWFYDDNPYWRNWVIKAQDFPLRTLSNYNTLEEQLNFEVIRGSENHIDFAANVRTGTGYLMAKQPPVSGIISKDNVSYDSVTGQWSNGQYFTVNGTSTLRVHLTPLTIEVPYLGSVYDTYGYLQFKSSQANAQLNMTAQLVDRDNESIIYGTKSWPYRLGDIIFSATYLSVRSSWISNSLPVPEYIDGVNQNLNPVNMRLKLTLQLDNVASGVLIEWRYDGAGWMDRTGYLQVRTTNTAGARKITTTELIRSYSQFDYNDLWNNDYNPFDFILNYCRMFRISVRVDNKQKKVIFKPIHKYLDEGDNTLNWSDKVDYSKDFVIKPISWENRYIKFNYEDNDLKDNKKYLEKYGVNYGELKIQTEYKFNSETTDLFSNVNSVMGYTPYVNSWNNLYNNLITYILPSEWYTENVDLDNKQQDLFGYFGFVRDAYAFNRNYGLRTCSITDDHYQEITTEHYCYNQTVQETVDVAQYRTIEDYYYKISGSYNLYATFNVPMEIYVNGPNITVRSVYDIYTLFWQRYIEERYDKNNKVVTCYINITPEEYQNFEFNKFVNIDNQLYFVNRIFDFNLTSNEPTKVELITIQDPAAYRTNLYDEIL